MKETKESKETKETKEKPKTTKTKETKEKKETKKKTEKTEKKQKNKTVIKIVIALSIIIIAVIIFGCVIYYFNSNKVETRLKPTPSNYYSQSTNYIVYNGKIYYYSIDSENRGRIYKMNFDGSENELVSASEYLKTPEFIYGYENNLYCESQSGASLDDKVIMKINLDNGEMDKIKEEELPLPEEEIKDLEENYDEIRKEHSDKEATNIYIVNDKIIFDYNCNVVSKNAINKIAIYDTKTKEYKEYENLRHFDIDRKNNCIYTVGNNYNINTINL